MTETTNGAPPAPPLTVEGAMLEMLTKASKHQYKLFQVPFEGFNNAVEQKALTTLVVEDCLQLVDVCLMPVANLARDKKARIAVTSHRIFRITIMGNQKRSMLIAGVKT